MCRILDCAVWCWKEKSSRVQMCSETAEAEMRTKGMGSFIGKVPLCLSHFSAPVPGPLPRTRNLNCLSADFVSKQNHISGFALHKCLCLIPEHRASLPLQLCISGQHFALCHFSMETLFIPFFSPNCWAAVKQKKATCCWDFGIFSF